MIGRCHVARRGRPRRPRSWEHFLLGLALVLGAAAPAHAQAPAAGPAPAPELQAGSAALIDVASGRLLYAKNGQLPGYPASITKILTALVAVHKLDLSTPVEVSPWAARAEGSSIYLRPGMRLPLRDLLYGLLLESGNDAARAIAEAVAGSESHFAQLMNAEAARLGARHTRFTNASGLPDARHVTTAVDMALITRAALLDPTLRQIVSTPVWRVRWPDGSVHLFLNHNRLLGRPLDGVKTGYTRAAGNTFVGSATRDGWQLAVVLLRDNFYGQYEDTLRLLEWGWSRFRRVPVPALARPYRLPTGDGRSVLLTAASPQPFLLPVLPGEEGRIRVQRLLPAAWPPRLAAGEVVGEAVVWVGDRPAAEVPLVTALALEPPGGGR
ncbi:MAG: D-alanyl-D-alanine carboxypeptidase [Clostridia bacterium]|nr:D-alanyl-D-alanine carboxypeptidase [Clostridia bacterium]MCL6522233.1 D-alanyl-D-alanine carboxypeptidase [Bacillota bacterium]